MTPTQAHELVESKIVKASSRQRVRQDAEPVRYWSPRYQEWLSLNELAYFKGESCGH